MKKIYFIDGMAINTNDIATLEKELHQGDELHIFVQSNIPKVLKKEIQGLEKYVTYHPVKKTGKKQIDFKIMALYALYSAYGEDKLTIISQNTQLLQAAKEVTAA